MKRALVPLIGLLALAAAILWSNGLGGDVAYADGGPHGGYQDVSGGLPSQCAACHREHQGKSVGKLLKAASQYGLCLTCHNGAGSQLDVLDGVKLGAIIDPDAAAVGFVENVPLAITMSAAPYANLNSYASGQVFFTIAVRSSGPATTLNLSVADSNLVDFNASTIEDMSGTAIATFNAAAGPAVGYFRVKSSAKSTAVDTDSNLATLTADSGGTNIVLKLQMRIGTNPNVLNGGGFINVNGLPITSRHNEDPAENALNPWGYNSNTGQNTNALINPLQCTSCHNPHGTANYRLLKQTVNSQTVNVKAWYSGAFTKDEGGAGISGGTQPADKYAKEYYGSEADGSGAPTTGGGSMA
ncbi:MAG TPA: cytochrome c3 family protein, partial [Dehalococcoidia bacterium]|nr:cytochrome c3 family protein [Dehalococcoidia bacterium]